MSELDYEQRVEAGIHELCDLARHMDPDEAEKFFRVIAYRALQRHRRMGKEAMPSQTEGVR